MSTKKYTVIIESFAKKHYLKKMQNESVKSSVNRCILSHNTVKNEIRMLLIYHKNDIGGSNETQWWKKMITNNYGKYNIA